MVIGAVLLAASDLWTLQAQAVGGLLDVADVPHEVISDAERLARTELGGDSRAGRTRTAHGPVVAVPAPVPDPATPLQAGAVLIVAAAVVAAMVLDRRLTPTVKTVVLVVLWVWAATIAYTAWWSPTAPLDLRALVVDWRTSALAPICGIAILFAYDLYPLAGGFVLKTAWVIVAFVTTAAFSTLRLAVVAAGHATYGTNAFLALWQLAGTFWDLAPAIAVLALAHASVSVSAVKRRRWFLP